DFGDKSAPQINGKIDTVKHTYPSNQVFTAKFTTYNNVGCISGDSVLVDFAGGLKAGFTTSANSVCAGKSITFTDKSTAAGVSGNVNKWIWDFGDSSPKDSSGISVSHIYT